ncbi:uncharacterized protein LOC111611337 isoform X2 [Xiphophorus maculatus]|uniref:uncharacterized protein LOC111611337 isoform X2 n=1 Tax=Xiphophorus maculatus TaxID=8083 RepID=UPI000C6E8F36|nr:uncharacterized protein LOC111611337 isoform X2 [Xiphophorus maculatus]
MAQLPWIQGFFFIILQLTAAAAEQRSHFVVRDGDEVTLPAQCFRNQVQSCNKTTWIFSGQGNTTVTLYEDGKIHKDSRIKSDRLSVTANCSLVIKKISVEDVGLYACRQFDSSGHNVAEWVVDLSVVKMTEQKISDETILICSVLKLGGCSHSVKWLYDKKDDENIRTITPPQSACSATVSFTTSPHVSTSKRSELFRCQVKPEGNIKEFTFRISPPREKPGTTRPTKVTTTLTRMKPTKAKETIQPTTGSYSSNSEDLWKYVAAAVGSVLLIIIIAAAIRWRKIEGNKTQMNKNTLVPAGSQAAGGSSHNLDDPEGGVTYASISYTKKTNRNNKVIDHEDDDDGTVDYSTVNFSS